MEPTEREKREATSAERQAAAKLHLAMGILEYSRTPKAERVPIEGGHEGAGADFRAYLDPVMKVVCVPNAFGEPIPDQGYRDWLNETPADGNPLTDLTWGAVIAEALYAAARSEFAEGELEWLWQSLERRAR